MANTYVIEYQFTKNKECVNGFLEIDSKRFPSERNIRKEIASWTKHSRVSNLCYISHGATDENGKKLEAAE